MKVSRVGEMRAMDRMAIEQFGISAELLMENAGHAAYFVLRNEFRFLNKRFLIFCGMGNNGGDGFVLARKIHANGGEVRVILLGDPGKYQGPAAMNYEILARLPIAMAELHDLETAREAIANCDLIVDAILGTGLSREVEGKYRKVIELINASHKPVLSIDIPSGVHGDTGKIMGVAVRADLTVTFGLPKLGNMLDPGYDLCGKLFVSHISFPPSLHQSDSLRIEINQPVKLPSQYEMDDKGPFGKLLVIGGASSHPEALYFSALSFLKSGGRYSCLAVPRSIAPFIASKGDEIELIPQEETAYGNISLAGKDALLQLAEDVDMVILGPGWSLHEESQRLTRELALEINKPMILYGDSIAALCADLEVLGARKGATVIVPSLAEMACITSKSLSEVDLHKVPMLQKTAESLGVIIILRGHRSLIGLPDRRVFINMSGISRDATEGSGDILTGATAAMYSLGLPLEDAVRQGVFIHGLAENLTARVVGQEGLTAQDVLDHLPLAVASCREGANEEFLERYVGVHSI